VNKHAYRAAETGAGWPHYQISICHHHFLNNATISADFKHNQSLVLLHPLRDEVGGLA